MFLASASMFSGSAVQWVSQLTFTLQSARRAQNPRQFWSLIPLVKIFGGWGQTP